MPPAAAPAPDLQDTASHAQPRQPREAEARAANDDGPMLRLTGPKPRAAPMLLAADALLAALFWAIASWIVIEAAPSGGLPGVLGFLLYPACFILFTYALGLYRRDTLVEPRRAIGRVPLAAGLGAATASMAVFILPEPLGGQGAGVLFGAAVLAFTASAMVARGAFFVAFRRGAFRQRLLVIGAGKRAWDMVWLLRNEGRTIVQEVAFVHDPRMGEIDPRLAEENQGRIFSAAEGFLPLARRFRADQIVVAPDERRGMPMTELLACRTAGFPVREYHRFLEREIGRIDLKRLDIGSLLYAEGFTFSVIDLALKRLLDIAASALMLLITAPFLALAALAVKLDDGGPILYRQERVTRGGRVFRIMKLRTMTVNAEAAGAVWAAKQDPRITRIGRFLRRTRLDELPQLVNVLRGDMSFVGPRPERPEFTAELARELPLYNERHLVRAGLTGWAQVNYPYGASLDDARSKLSYDLYYVKNFSVVFDVLIILQTLRVVLWPGGGVR
jgi:sugar transferase (PEP-CTERM system associated)